MGLFDNFLKKASKVVSDAVESEAFGELKKAVTDKLNSEDNGITNNFKSYAIPEKYNMFPVYNGNMLGKPVERNTIHYERITTRYSGAPSSEFISSLLHNGFVKGSTVRYDRANTYVIVEDLGNKTEIVYHIKK